MADIDMADAPAPKTKTAKASASADTGDKKRFEVKKVGLCNAAVPPEQANVSLVERCCSLGMGYRR